MNGDNSGLGTMDQNGENCRKEMEDRYQDQGESASRSPEYLAEDYVLSTDKRHRDTSQSRSRSRHEQSTLKKKRVQIQQNNQMEYDEEEDQEYGQEQEQMESTGMNGMGMEQEYDQEEESPDGGEGEEYGEESAQRSNAHPYPKQNPNGGLEQRLEQIKNNIKS